MRPTIALCLLVLTAADAAPRLVPRAEFISHTAHGGNTILSIKGRDTGTIRFIADFTVSGPGGATYMVELYVEANGTGEKARLIDRKEVSLPNRKDGAAEARGQFDRHQLDRILGDKKVGIDHLPQPVRDSGWSYRLVLKRDGDDPVADTGIHWAPYTWGPK